MVMLKNKSSVKFFIYTLAGFLTCLLHSYTCQQAGSFLIEDLYKLNLSATEQLWMFLAFFLAYAVNSNYSFPHLASKCVPKAPAVGTMLLSGIMLKMGLYIIVITNCSA
jgi:NADH-quinone oxidoreductase subunit M